MNLPAGILPNDKGIEFFAKPGMIGRCYFLQHGETKQFCDIISTEMYSKLLKDLFKDNPKAVEAMKKMGVKAEDMLEHYNYCNRGNFDGIADITESGNLSTEYVDCGRHGKCVGEGKVCKMEVNGVKITHRERECLSLTSKGRSYSQICSDMGFKSQTAVNSLMERLRSKLNASDKTELALIARQFGIL